MDISSAEYRLPVLPSDQADGAPSCVNVPTVFPANLGAGEPEPRSGFAAILWRHRSLWVMPLVSEVLLLAVAANLALAFGKVMQRESHVPDWGWVLGCGLVFVVMRIFIAWRELFLPRAVALFVVILLSSIAIGLLAGVLVSEPWHEVFEGLSLGYRMLAGLPLVLFLARMAGVLRVARFSPALGELDRWYRSGGRGMWKALCDRLEFWMH